MTVFVSVKSKDGSFIEYNEQFPCLNSALSHVSSNYVTDSELPFRWTGYFALRSGEITWLKMKRTTTAECLREDITEIDVLNDRGLLEKMTFEKSSSH